MNTRIYLSIKATLLALLCLISSTHFVQAEAEDYSADGERRAKSAGQSLVGTLAPQMTIVTIDGQTIDLANVYGKKPVYIKFWATWCVPCRQQMPGFEAIYTKYGEKVQVIAVNTGISDNLKSVNAFREKMHLTMPITIDDGKLARAFNLRVTPQHLLIDKRGKFAYFGHKDDEKFHQALNKLVAEKVNNQPVSNPTFIVNDSGYKQGHTVANLSLSSIDDVLIDIPFNRPKSKKVGLVFFGPWCEWYLEETEPKTSKACKQVRELLESKSKKSNIQWINISTNLWSSVADLQDYRKSYKTTLPIVFDKTGNLFTQFDVNQLPTIILIDANGKISLKSSIQDDDFAAALHTISKLK